MVRWGRHLGVLILEGEQASKEEDVARPAVELVHGQKEKEEEKKRTFLKNPLDLSVNTRTFKAVTSCIFLGFQTCPKIMEKFMVAHNVIERPHIFLR